MDVQVTERVLRVQIITLNGRLDAFYAPQLRKTYQALLDTGVIYFVLDLRDVEFMDSAAMAALVSLLKQSRSAGGTVIMVKPVNENALRILMLTKFDRVFHMSDTVDSAVREVFA